MSYRVEMAADLLARCATEVSATFPLESGGVLMGRRTDACVVIDHVIGPGPAAKRGRYRFASDTTWQHERIAERFYATSGESTYLGDWHSHPQATHGDLSSADVAALRLLMDSAAAQCPDPLMLILWGGPRRWNRSLWRAEPTNRWWTKWRTKVTACDLVLV